MESRGSEDRHIIRISLSDARGPPICPIQDPSTCTEHSRREVFLDEESNELPASYIRERVITGRFLADSQHIAIATAVNADVMISWNFKHIVNIERIRGFNSVNIKLGYGTMEIRSPWEVVGHE